MRILIVGASSFIGCRIFNDLIKRNNLQIQGTYYKNKKNSNFKYLDITNEVSIFKVLDNFKPDVVLWIAGSKNLTFCEKNIENAKELNTYPIERYIEASKKLNLKEHFIYFSTDYIFDGRKGNFNDTDTPNPSTNYGLSNYLAEVLIQKSLLRSSIIRISAVIGQGGSFFDWVIEELKNKESIELFNDTYFTPTPVKLLIENITYIIESKKLGVFNICGKDRLNRYEFVNILKSLDEIFRADLIPVKVNKNMPYMQYDLSMVASNFCNDLNNKELVEYLIEELKND